MKLYTLYTSGDLEAWGKCARPTAWSRETSRLARAAGSPIVHMDLGNPCTDGRGQENMAQLG